MCVILLSVIVDIIVITTILLCSLSLKPWLYPFLFYLQVCSSLFIIEFIILLKLPYLLTGYTIFSSILSSHLLSYSTICEHYFIIIILLFGYVLLLWNKDRVTPQNPHKQKTTHRNKTKHQTKGSISSSDW